MGLWNLSKDKKEEFSNRLLLVDKSWVWVNHDGNSDRIAYIFRSKENKLLISKDGSVERKKWDYIKASNNILIEESEKVELFHLVFIRDNYLVLELDYEDDKLLFVNESFYRNKYAKLEGRIFDAIARDLKKLGHHLKNKESPVPVQRSKEKAKIKIIENITKNREDTISSEKAPEINHIKKAKESKDDIARHDEQNSQSKKMKKKRIVENFYTKATIDLNNSISEMRKLRKPNENL